jgi:hypothetical protein
MAENPKDADGADDADGFCSVLFDEASFTFPPALDAKNALVGVSFFAALDIDPDLAQRGSKPG